MASSMHGPQGQLPTASVAATKEPAWVGVRLAAHGWFADYRDRAVRGEGIDAGLRADGRLFAGAAVSGSVLDPAQVASLRATLGPAVGSHQVSVRAFDRAGNEIGSVVQGSLDTGSLYGNIALVCSGARCGFSEWRVDGPKVDAHDEHDMYHGHVWGAGGRDANDIVPALQREGVGVQTQKQDSGGYTMPVDWVNVVQRTQTSHLPDPVDPAPTERGIGVYFTELVWGGVSYAILEDRKWKSAPAVVLPDAQIVNGWARNPEWDSSKTGGVKGAELLGALG